MRNAIDDHHQHSHGGRLAELKVFSDPRSKSALERIGALESTLQRANERIEIVLDLVHRQATTGLYDHAMLDAPSSTFRAGAVEGG